MSGPFSFSVPFVGSLAGLDPATQAFLTAAGITLNTTYYAGTGYQLTGYAMAQAVDRFVRDMKGQDNPAYTTYNQWPYMRCEYPMVGGTAQAHAVNLRTPGTYNLTFINVTHSAIGITGSAGSADTGFIPAVAGLPLNSNLLGYYTAGTDTTGTQIEMGMADDGASRYFSLITSLTGNAYFENSTGGMLQAAVTTPAGYTQAGRSGATSAAIYKNLTTLISSTSVPASAGYPAPASPANFSIRLLQRNSSAGTFSYPSKKPCQHANIGDNVPAAWILARARAVQALQTALHRQVTF